jgi:hypothetical protein
MNKPPRSQAKPLRDLVGKTIADAFARQGFANTGLITHWHDIVGPEIAANAEPVRMQWPRRSNEEEPEPATLILRVDGPVALEIQHLSGLIIERVNRFFGWRAVGRIALRQAPLAARRPKAAPPPPDPQTVARIAAALGDVADEGLRQALARLGANVKAK